MWRGIVELVMTGILMCRNITMQSFSRMTEYHSTTTCSGAGTENS